MSERLIVNASPLVFLGNAGRLDLLRELGGGSIAVPEAVLRDRVTLQAVESATPQEIVGKLSATGLRSANDTVDALVTSRNDAVRVRSLPRPPI